MTTTLALALVAVLAYFIGRWNVATDDSPMSSTREMKRAWHVVRELECILLQLRRTLNHHRGKVQKFRQKLSKLDEDDLNDRPMKLADESEQLLKPIVHLSTQLVRAYEELRQQSNALLSFTEVRRDPLTAVCNRRALDETLTRLFAMYARYGNSFVLAIFDIDHFKKINDEHGHLYGDEILRDVARILDFQARETDTVTRYGGEEFVVVMPQTTFAGAATAISRIRSQIAQELNVTISAGVAMVRHGDSEQLLLARADEALYAAKEGGRDCAFVNDNGEMSLIEE